MPTSNTANAPRANIHLDHIEYNFELAKRLSPNSRVMAVVKSDAYGHDAVRVCQQLSKADSFAVARVSEGLELRRAGIEKNIIILEGFLDHLELRLCHDYSLTPVIHSAYQLECLDTKLPVWLKINTGMNRLGFNLSELKLNLQSLKQNNVVGVLSHFANADRPEKIENLNQAKIFSEAVAMLGLDVDFSFANSDCIASLPEYQFDWIRPGIMLYGSLSASHSDQRFNDQGLRCGMTLTAPIIAINSLQAGDTIGYGSIWRAKKDCRVAVVGLGYADGYPREMPEGTPILVNGQRRKLVGRISMDMLFVELAEEDQVHAGEHVTFWGADLPIDEIAKCANTIAYTLMTGLTSRVRRTFSGDAEDAKKGGDSGKK